MNAISVIKRCIKVVISGIILMFSSCSDEILEPYHPVLQVAVEFVTFQDYQKTGIYLLDTRYLYHNILYHFDFSKEQWSITGSGNGLPKSKAYFSLKVFESFSVSPDSIISVTTSGEVFSFDLKNNKWELLNGNKLISYDFYGYNTIRLLSADHACLYNEYDKHVYFFNLNDNLEVFILGNNFKWQKINSINIPRLRTINFLSFLDKENIQLVNQLLFFKQDNFEYMQNSVYIADSLYVIHFNVSTGNYSTYKSMQVGVPYHYFASTYGDDNFSFYSENRFYTVNNMLYSLNFDSADNRKMVFSKILLNNEVPFNTDTLKTEEYSNSEDFQSWGEIYYRATNRKRIYFYNNNYYLFINEFPYKYSPQTKQWTALQPCPFKTLNKK